MRLKHRILFTSLLLSGMLCFQNSGAQSLKNQAQTIRTAFDNLDLDKFISIYADTVHYIDPNYGSNDRFSRATIRAFMTPLFDKSVGLDLKLYTVAVDEQEGSLLIRGDVYDKVEEKRLPFVVFQKFEKGKVVQQIDFPVYPVESLREAPRYKGYFKEKGDG